MEVGALSDPLSEAQKAELREAEARVHRLLRPARIAAVNGWTVAVFGGLSVLWGLVAGGTGIVVGIVLVGIGWIELRGRNRLRALDPEATRLLGWNQLALAGVVVAYCTLAVVRARVAPDPGLAELERMAGLPADLVADLTTLVYGGVAVVVTLVQVLMARYHFGKREAVESFVRETPEWIRELVTRSS